MKTIIRVEHKDGLGMFVDRMTRSHSVTNILPEIDHRHCNFNTPCDDKLTITSLHFCAYKSIEHIQEWIKPYEFKVLFEHGYKVYMIDVSEWQEGKDNVLFKKEHILLKKNISSLFITI